jgi:hypothetical protein
MVEILETVVQEVRVVLELLVRLALQVLPEARVARTIPVDLSEITLHTFHIPNMLVELLLQRAVMVAQAAPAGQQVRLDQ